MPTQLGNIAEDQIIYFPWSTQGADGASITRATDGTISVYKDDGTTQSVAGITDTEDFDSLTGIHMCKIDTSADAFYAVGSDYAVVLSAATIDGQTVNAVLALFSIENRFSVWDEALSGHQVQGTAGAAITMAAYLGPRGPGVYIDDGAANTDTTLGEDGTLENPVSTIAAATTIAAALGIQRFYLVNNTSITLAQTYEDHEFVGIGISNQINLGSQDVDNSEFHNLTMTGTQGGSQFFCAIECRLNGLLAAEIIAYNCWFIGDVTMRAASNQSFDACKSAVPGGGTPNLVFPGSGTTTVNFRHYSGGLTVKDATANDVMSYETDGQLVIDASCTSLTIHVRGNCTITDNGTTTALTQDAAVNRTDFPVDVVKWRGVTPLNLSSQRVQTFVAGMQNSVFGAATATQGARQIFAAELLAWETSGIEAIIAESPRSLYGVIAGMTHKRTRTDTEIVIYKADDVTVLTTIPITEDATLNPIDSIDPPA